MFLGHYAVAFAAKGAAPRTNLGVLFAAAQLPDLIWPAFLLLGWERVEIDPGNTAFAPLAFVSYPISHSLLSDIAIGAALGAAYYGFRRDLRAAAVIALLVVSHWILDWVTHAPDLPVIPGGRTFGLGLWNNVAATFVVEVLLFVAGLTVYLRATRAVDRVGRVGPIALAVLLLLIYIGNAMGPPPPNVTALAIVGLAAWLFPLLAAFVDRRRVDGRRDVSAPSAVRQATG